MFILNFKYLIYLYFISFKFSYYFKIFIIITIEFKYIPRYKNIYLLTFYQGLKKNNFQLYK